jgi:hypothetical protein
VVSPVDQQVINLQKEISTLRKNIFKLEKAHIHETGQLCSVNAVLKRKINGLMDTCCGDNSAASAVLPSSTKKGMPLKSVGTNKDKVTYTNVARTKAPKGTPKRSYNGKRQTLSVIDNTYKALKVTVTIVDSIDMGSQAISVNTTTNELVMYANGEVNSMTDSPAKNGSSLTVLSESMSDLVTPIKSTDVVHSIRFSPKVNFLKAIGKNHVSEDEDSNEEPVEQKPAKHRKVPNPDIFNDTYETTVSNPNI